MLVKDQPKEPSVFLAWGLLILLSLIWGSSFILIKKALIVYSPEQLGTMRIFAAFAVLLPFALARLGRVEKKHWKYLAISGLTGSLGPAILFSTAGKYLDSAIIGALNAITPLFTLLVGVAFFTQRISLWKSVGLFIGFIGSVGLIFVRQDGAFDLDINLYVLLVIAATICYGVNLNLIRNYLSDVKPLLITALSLLTVGPWAGAYLFLATDFTHRFSTYEGSGLALFYILLLGVGGTAIAFILFNRLIQLSGTLFASSTTYLIPVVAFMWGVLDGERLMPAHLLGMAAIITGVLIVNRSK
jgi:drug/metabolite transporter (DMT)-like permease